MATRYVDLEGGNDANDGTTFALRKKTIASAMSGLTTGAHVIRVMASPDPQSLAQAATWTNGSETVTLTSAVTANIDTCEVAWTAAANVTATASTSTYREGTASANLVVAAAFTTGLIAYKALGASTDFSAYQQISFLLRTSGALAANVLQLALCSDTAGATAVNTVNIPAVAANTWLAITVDTAAALGAAIQSVALYAASDPGSVTINLDNIIACKAASAADALTHQSLISKNTGADEPWFAIETINGTSIVLGAARRDVASRVGLSTKYFGTTEAVTTYRREAIVMVGDSITVSGADDAGRMEIQGGWDRTGMTTQSGVTWIRPPANEAFNAVGLLSNGPSFTYINKFYFARYSATSGTALYAANSSSNVVGEIGLAACYAGIYFAGVTNPRIEDGQHFVGNYQAVYAQGATKTQDGYIKLKKCWGMHSSVSYQCCLLFEATNGARWLIDTSEIKNTQSPVICGPQGFAELRVRNAVMDSNYLDVKGANPNGRMYFDNCAFQVNPGSNSTTRAYCTKFNQVAGDHRIFWEDSLTSTIVSATDQRHTASGVAWKFSPKSAQCNARTPLYLEVAKIACSATEARTVSLWMRRDNTGLTMRLRVQGGQIAGVASDVSASMTAAANTWEQVQITFTPTEAGVVVVHADAYGGSTYNGWIDDLTVA